MKKILLTLFGTAIFLNGLTQNNVPVIKNPDGSETIYCTNFHITKPLRELALEYPVHDSIYAKRAKRYDDKGSSHTRRTPQTFLYSAEKDGPAYGNDASLIQNRNGQRNDLTKAPILNVEGQDATGFRPMDPSGAAGATYYMQAINGATYRIINKTTGATVTSGSLGALWTPDVPNDGDPIVMFDRHADRWFVSQFGVSGNRIYIAISTTNDPTGSWYSYTFTSPNFPDYLKFGIWQDGYYMTSNQSPARIFAFERSAMLTGSPTAKAVSQTFSPPSPGGFYCPMPGDAEIGALPPSGTPCPIFLFTDNGWGIGGVGDAIRIYNSTVNWSGAGSMTITLSSTLATSAFDGSYDPSWNDISQPSTAQKLDGIGGIVQYRAQWSNWTTHRSVVLSWPVEISATQRSVMWAELRQNTSTGVWSINQQSIYAPDTKSRWLSGIAMDENGSIGLCYARCSSASGDFMGLYYTGRLATDPLNTMTIAEQTAFAGTGYQTGANRVGDYAHTAMDPDGETFWHTSEYMETPSGSNAATTRIYSFKIALPGPVASCTIASSDADNIICSGSCVTFTATPTNGGSAPTYQWYVNGSPVGTGGTTYTNCALTTGAVVTCVMTSNLTGVVGSPCTSNAITTTVNSPPTTSNAGADQTVCAATCTMAGNVPTTGTGTWTFVSGPATPTITTPTSATTGITGMSAVGTYVFTWTISNNPCIASSDNVSITRNGTPSTSNAGPDQTICATTTSVTMAGNTPTTGTGTWTKISGPAGGTITTPTSPTTTITALVAGTYVYQWTIANPPCTNSTDQMSIVVNSAPTTSNAGADQTVCGLTTTMAGNTPTTGSGVWAQVSGPGTSSFGSSTSPTSSVTATVAGTYVYSWTISNNPCTASTDNISITYVSSPTAANAGPDQTICTATATLAGNTITTGTGSWSFISGPSTPTIVTPSSPTSGITGMASLGTYVFQWNAANAPCPSSTDQVNIVVSASFAPGITISITTGTNPSCSSQPVTFTATVTSGGASPTYQWQVNGSNVGTGASTYTTSTLVTGDVVTCILGSSDPCASPSSVTSAGITMTVNPTPASPTITMSGADLVSSSATGNQWYLDGVLIPGATSQTYTPTANGTYTVVVTESGCSSPSSAGTFLNNVSIVEIDNVFGLTVYPNPNNGEFTVNFNGAMNKEFKLRLTNAIGQVVYTENLRGTGSKLSVVVKVKDVQTGMYNLTLTSEGTEVIKKVVIH
ncbi:MAG TPA: T9SS type A sorting domain-containing protein [Flavobacteriales bacterium]|nr:T9SS type A sorting domain-containing protein [Flavobacteriales bacterium]